MVSAPARRRQVDYALRRGLSERRACALMSVARSTLRYVPRMPARDAPVLAAMVSLSAQYPRFGYQRIQVFLDRQGHNMSADRVWRLWRPAKLPVPRKRPRRRVDPPERSVTTKISQWPPAATGWIRVNSWITRSSLDELD